MATPLLADNLTLVFKYQHKTMVLTLSTRYPALSRPAAIESVLLELPTPDTWNQNLQFNKPQATYMHVEIWEYLDQNLSLKKPVLIIGNKNIYPSYAFQSGLFQNFTDWKLFYFLSCIFSYFSFIVSTYLYFVKLWVNSIAR